MMSGAPKPIGDWLEETNRCHRSVSLPGEKIVYCPAEVYTLVVSSASDEFTNGCIIVSNYRFFFHGMSRPLQNSVFYISSSENQTIEGCDVDVPLGVIAEVRKLTSNVSGSKVYGFELVTKDFRPVYRFLFGDGGKKTKEAAQGHAASRNGAADAPGIVSLLQGLVFCEISDLFAFHSGETFPDVTPKDGWHIYDVHEEFERLGLKSEDSGWRVSEVNHEFSVVDTYARLLVVPKETTDDMLRRVANYRSRGRIPVLSWVHPVNGAALVRSSQPQSGLGSKRCAEDEEMFRHICNANQSNRVSQTGSVGSVASLPDLGSTGQDGDANGIIFDARPMINAHANRATGGGIENLRGYKGAKYRYLDIANIHVMRGSLMQLHELIHSSADSSSWLRLLDKTEWLVHVHRILDGAVKIAEQIERNRRSVLLHCSDGWDRTAQLSSIVMLMLDPFYRTFRGFAILIEKEWVSYGHKLADRSSQGPNGRDGEEEASPVFLQFVDATWQLMNQFPHAFEFNSDFLVALMDHFFSCRFGTFLFNCDRERRNANVRERTQSVWAFFKAQGADGRWNNHLFRFPEEGSPPVLNVRTEVAALGFWGDYYARWRHTARERAHRDFLQKMREFLAEHQQPLGRMVRAGRKVSSKLRKRTGSTISGRSLDDEEEEETGDAVVLLAVKERDGLREVGEVGGAVVHPHPAVNI